MRTTALQAAPIAAAIFSTLLAGCSMTPATGPMGFFVTSAGPGRMDQNHPGGERA